MQNCKQSICKTFYLIVTVKFMTLVDILQYRTNAWIIYWIYCRKRQAHKRWYHTTGSIIGIFGKICKYPELPENSYNIQYAMIRYCTGSNVGYRAEPQKTLRQSVYYTFTNIVYTFSEPDYTIEYNGGVLARYPMPHKIGDTYPFVWLCRQIHKTHIFMQSSFKRLSEKEQIQLT